MTRFGVPHTYSLLLVLLSFVFPQERNTFIIFEDIRPLILYNRYEQQLTQEEKENIPPYSAFEIRTNRTMLSDNFSIASQLQFDGHIMYVLLDSEGQIKNLSQAGEVFIFNRAELIHDTLIVTKNNSASIRDPVKNKPYRDLNKNDRVIRIFSFRNREYVRLLESPVFGWLDTTDPSVLKRFKLNSTPVKSFSDYDIAQIENYIQRINTQIENLFSVLNESTNQSRRAPKWHLTIFTDKIECYIDSYETEFIQTGIRLQSEIRRLLQNKNLLVSGPADHFTIEIKN
jgi:hypothetical protein